MVPTGSLYHVIVNGMAYPTDLSTLRQWVQQGRVRPETLVGKGTMKPIPAREVPALRDCFAQVAPPSYAPPSPPAYAPPQPQNSGYSQPYAPPTPPPTSYAPPSGGYGQSYAPPSNPQLQNSGYSQPYAPPTPPSPPAYAPPQPQNSGYSQPYAPPTPPPPSYAPPSGGYGQSYAPPSNPQLQNSGYSQPYAPPTPPSPPSYAPPQAPNSGYSQPYTTAPSLNAPTPAPRPPAPGTMAPLQPFHRDYAASASSGYSQPYAQPVSAPAYGAVSSGISTDPFPNEFHKQDSRYIDAMNKIRNGWIAGMIVSALTFLGVTFILLSGKEFAGVTGFGYIDVLIGLGLSFGIYSKSRVCAVAMVIYYLISKIVMWIALSQSGNFRVGVSGAVVPIIITIAFAHAITGTFKYHQLKAEAARGLF